MTADKSDSKQTWSLAQSVKAVLLIQIIAAGLLLLIVGIYHLLSTDGSLHGIYADFAAIVYGSALAIAATVLTARSVRRASPDGENKTLPGQAPVSLLPIFSGLLNKLVIVGGGIGFGLIVWGLDPIYVVLSYLLVQLAAAGQLMQKRA